MSIKNGDKAKYNYAMPANSCYFHSTEPIFTSNWLKCALI